MHIIEQMVPLEETNAVLHDSCSPCSGIHPKQVLDKPKLEVDWNELAPKETGT